MALEDSAGINVLNHFGPRDSGRATGVLRTAGNKTELSIELNGTMVTDGVFVEPYIIPAGALILAAYIEVDEVFVLTGTTPTILVGTDGSEVTNGLVVSEAIAEATGSANLSATLTGTWAAKLAAATTVGVALGGTTPVATSAGKAKLVIEYIG